MALFDQNSNSTLADVLGQQADTASMGIDNSYAKKKKQAVAKQAANGGLGSGVFNYTMGDINAGQLSDLGGVYGNLASALGEIGAQEYGIDQDSARKYELAKMIGEASQSGGGPLDAIMGGLQGVGSGALSGYMATGNPWGALAGGVLSGGLGAYGGMNKRRKA